MVKFMALVYIGIGSNEGNRVGAIQQALEALDKSVPNSRVKRVSSLYETPALVEGTSKENLPGDFLNCVAEVQSDLSPQDLLKALLQVEKEIGRDRPGPPGGEKIFHSRMIDLDLLFYDGVVVQTESLTVPHPRAHERSFVMIPMRELSPDYVHPVLVKTVAALCEEDLRPQEIHKFPA
jgi:2-amino-4-hydroxy-6-hydroxymethyldihydropteridine diphosphokinase